MAPRLIGWLWGSVASLFGAPRIKKKVRSKKSISPARRRAKTFTVTRILKYKTQILTNMTLYKLSKGNTVPGSNRVINIDQALKNRQRDFSGDAKAVKQWYWCDQCEGVYNNHKHTTCPGRAKKMTVGPMDILLGRKKKDQRDEAASSLPQQPLLNDENVSTINLDASTPEEIQEEESEAREKPWTSDAKYSWFAGSLDAVDRALTGDSGRANRCNQTRKDQTPCQCRPKGSIPKNLNSNIFLDPPNPLLFHEQNYDPMVWTRVRIYFWLPELFFSKWVKHMPCPKCGDVAGAVKRKGWSKNGPRRVSCLGREFDIIWKYYYCSECKCEFQGGDLDVIKKLPEFIQAQFPIAFRTSRTAIDKTFAALIDRQVVKGQSFADIQNMYQEINNTFYYQTMLSYMQLGLAERSEGSFIWSQHLIQEFPEYKERAGWYGIVPCTPFLVRAYEKRSSELYECRARFMSSLTGEVLKADHTYKIAKLPSINSTTPFKGMYSVLNEVGQVLGYWMTTSDSLTEIDSDLSALRLRNNGAPNSGIKLFYTDRCCLDDGQMFRFFPELLTSEDEPRRLLLDPFHFLNRFDVPKYHPLFKLFMSRLRMALFVDSYEDVMIARAIAALEDSSSARVSNGELAAQQKIRRKIPAAQLVTARVKNVVETFQMLDAYFRTDRFTKTAENCFKHLERGCLSDHPEVNLYREMPGGLNSRHKKFKCARGTSQNENYHGKVVEAYGGFRMRPELFDLILMDFNTRWNINRGISYGIYQEYKVYDISLINSIWDFFQKNRRHFSPNAQMHVAPFAQSTSELENFGCKATACRTKASVFDSTIDLEDADAELVVREATEGDSDEDFFEDAREMNYEALRREVLDKLYYKQYIPTEIRQPEEYSQLFDILEKTQKETVDGQEISELWNKQELKKMLEDGGFLKVQSKEVIELALKQAEEMAITAQSLDGNEHLLHDLNKNLRVMSTEVEILPALPAFEPDIITTNIFEEAGLIHGNEVFHDASDFVLNVPENTDRTDASVACRRWQIEWPRISLAQYCSELNAKFPPYIDDTQMNEYPDPDEIKVWKDHYGDGFGLCGGCFWPSFVWRNDGAKKTKFYINGHLCNSGICNVTGKQLNKNALKNYKKRVKRRKLNE